MDVDLLTDLRGLLPLVAPLLSGHSDLAIGTRLAHGARVVRGPKRELISRAYNALLRVTLRARFSDAQCGFKAVRADLLPDLLPDVRDDGWFFDTELLVSAQRRGPRIHEVPVDWIDDPDSRVRIVRTAVDDLRGVARLMAAAPIARFAAVGVMSTIAHALLFLALRGVLGAVAANAVALALTAIGNTAANRRFTFRVRGRSGLVRHHLRGGLVFVLTLALTNCALLVLHGIDASPAQAVELAVLGRGESDGDRDPLRRDAHLGLRPAPPPHHLPPTHHYRQENRMNPRTFAVIVGAVVLAGAAGIGVTAGGDSSSAATPSTMGRPGPGGFDVSALADELGVSESGLQDALEAARPSGGEPGSGRAEMAETLADELGLEVADVEAALEATMPSGGPGGPGGPPPGTDGTAPPTDTTGATRS